MLQDKKILIVEDEEINRAILNEMFYRDHETLEATNGQEALTLIEEHKDSIAVILLDVVMPVMDGVQFMEEMHKRNWIKDIPIVLITAEVSEKLSIQSYEFGISDVISKPFNPYIVKLRVGNIIELHSYRKDLEKIVQDQTVALHMQAQKLKASNSFFIEALNTAVEFRDNESGMHIQRIRDITRLFLENVAERYPAYNVLREDADLICDAAAMHDIGKIAIPDAILLKPGKLTEEEYEIMKTHSIKGCEILDKLSIDNLELLGYCYDICRHHHERWNGKGYPDGLSGDDISIWAQIVSIADVYDALVSKRVYKEARSHETALEMILTGECGMFNPMLLACLQEMASSLKQSYE
jgi:putative two-component system response regulator